MILLSVLLSLLPCVSPATPPHTADLIGYGPITIDVRRGPAQATIVFTCADDARADRLLSKLRADLTWDRLLGPRSSNPPGPASALQLESGALLLARHGRSVYATAGSTAAAAHAALGQLKLAPACLRFLPERPHPMALDFYDLRSVSMYQMPLNVLSLARGLQRYDPQQLARPADFWARFGLGYSQFGPFFGLAELADGACEFFPLDYATRLAADRDQVFMTHCGQHLAPWWLRNRFPSDIVAWDPYAITGWNGLEAMGGTHLSQWASDESYAYAQRFARATLDRLQTHAGHRLGAFRVSGGGHPGDEMGLHHMSTEFMDYDAAGQAAFRTWLRQTRGLQLADLGQRWHADPGRFRSWDQVRIPSHFEFFGGFGQGSFDLLQSWQWRPDSPAAEAQGWHLTDYRPGDEWTPTDLAPSMKQLFLFGSRRDKQLRQGKSTVAWFRNEFDPTGWLAQQPGTDVYLVAQVGQRRTEPVEVFFNQSYLGPIRPQVSCGPIALRITGLLKPGRNVLCLKIASGLIRGPVFLTRQQPRRYPYLGPQQNARWVDLRDWTAQKLTAGWKREARLGRQMLPDVPLLFCPGGCLAFWDQFLGLKRELGIASLHFTGGGPNYMPWWAGLGYVWGVYMSSEEGGTVAEPDVLSRELAYMLLGGVGHHNYYYGAIDYMQIEQQTGWFTRNRRLLDLLGKASWQPPQVAVLRAARTDRYFPYAEPPHAADLGFGPLQAAHFPNVYITEAELAADLAHAYPVLFDAGTSVFDDQLLAGIERYVRQGGTFIAVHNTGRHQLLTPDAWPIAQLTGYRVRAQRDDARLNVRADQSLLPQLAGHAFSSPEGLVLESTGAPDTRVVAQWDDGTPAVTQRQLGRGRVVLLGSTFWRNTADRTAAGAHLPAGIQRTVLRNLFAAVGVHSPAEAENEDLWLRRFTTKNGLQQWIMAFNAGRAPARAQTVSFPLAHRPARVVDVVTAQNVDFTWRDGRLAVPSLDLEPGAIRVLGVDQPDALGAVEHWFAQKCRYESRPVAPQPAKILPSPPPTAVTLDKFFFRQAPSHAKTDTAWLNEPTAAPDWKQVGCGFWDDQGFAPRGVGLYRQTFRVPDAWRGRRVLLALASYDTPVFLEQAELLVNGRPVGEYRAHGWANFDVLEITDHVRPGDNALAVRVEARAVRGAYLGGLVIFALEKLDDSRELTAGWRLFDDNRRYRSVTLPLNATGRHLETDVALPADWRAKHVLLEFDVADRWVGCVVINGRVITYNQSGHPYGNVMQVNLCPWVHPGQVNRIELWPRTPADTAQVKMSVRRVQIGAAPAAACPAPPDALLPLPPVPPPADAATRVITPISSTPPTVENNLLENAGFETWAEFDPKAARNVRLVPDHLAPLAWRPGREASNNTAPTATIARDPHVTHSGRYSVRLENRDMRDITFVQYSTEPYSARPDDPRRIRPSRRYALRWWVKAADVDPRGTGPILMMYTLSAHGGKTWRTNDAQPSPLPKGTFDWQRRELTFVTDEHVRSAAFSFQLRWTTGTAWYDDLQLVDLGPAVHVESY